MEDVVDLPSNGLRLVKLISWESTWCKIRLIRERLLETQSKQKAYADHQRQDLEFLVGDHVFLQVSLMKGVMRFRKKNKLNPHYIGPFEIIDWIGAVAYRLALSYELSLIHPIFHVSMLRKDLPDPSHVLAMHTILLDEDLTYEEKLIAKVDR